jgi:hypothetical protein
MSATVVSDRPATSGKVSEPLFISLARDYWANRKLIDALTASENPDEAVSRAMGVIGRLQHVVAEGSDYTPRADLGFGSCNAATIAAGIIGQGLTGAQLRKKFSDVGKPKK